MSRIVPFQPWHFHLIELQSEQIFAQSRLDQDMAVACEMAGPAWSCIDKERVFACAGIVSHETHGEAWAVLGERLGPALVGIHRAARRALANSPWQRIETLVRNGFENGERWAVSLGFICQRRNHVTGPDGRLYDLWTHHG